MNSVHRNKLFVAACLALLVTSLLFGIRAGILNRLGVHPNLNAFEPGTITDPVFWGFALAAPNSEMANALNEAKKASVPEIMNTTLIIALVLIVAFTILNLYMPNRRQRGLSAHSGLPLAVL